jgi:hypothetical protein
VVLIEWLNSAVGSKSYQRVSHLIRNIESATEVGNAAARDGVWWHMRMAGEPAELPREKKQRRRKIDNLLGPIEVAVKAYVFRPRLIFLMSGSRRWWFDLVGEPVPGDYKLTRADGRRVYEADAVFGVMRLASYGFLERVKQCLACQKWLYAHPPHKKFCDAACQGRYFASTPRQKEKRAEYMRDYRRRDKLNDYRIRQQLKEESTHRLARKPHRQ